MRHVEQKKTNRDFSQMVCNERVYCTYVYYKLYTAARTHDDRIRTEIIASLHRSRTLIFECKYALQTNRVHNGVYYVDNMLRYVELSWPRSTEIARIDHRGSDNIFRNNSEARAYTRPSFSRFSYTIYHV